MGITLRFFAALASLRQQNCGLHNWDMWSGRLPSSYDQLRLCGGARLSRARRAISIQRHWGGCRELSQKSVVCTRAAQIRKVLFVGQSRIRPSDRAPFTSLYLDAVQQTKAGSAVKRLNCHEAKHSESCCSPKCFPLFCRNIHHELRHGDVQQKRK